MQDINLIPKLEDLIIGSEDFRDLEARTDRFCPFEATGMVRQEIRHSHFLSFVLDSNRPHEFSDLFLKELLYMIAEGTIASNPYSKLAYHFMDYSNLRVLREWKHIDILIEISVLKGKGLIIAIENKIDSGEHSNQLSRYKKTVDDHYPSTLWNREFIFLTTDGTLPSEKNSGDWLPIALGDLISRFEKVVHSHGFSGSSTDTFNSYVLMLRRHILQNNELESLARKIWAQHREALETLNAFAPDLNGEILTKLGDSHKVIATAFSEATGMTIVPEESSRTILRFAVEDWDQYSELMSGDSSWMTTGRVLIIEVAQWGKNQFRISIVIGPGEKQVREAIYQAVLSDEKLSVGRRTATANAKWKHLSSAMLLKESFVRAAENDMQSADDLIPVLMTNAKNFLKRDLQRYDQIVSGLFTQ